MSAAKQPLIQCYVMTSQNGYNNSTIAFENMTQSPDKTLVYQCDYLDVRERAKLLLTDPTKAIAMVLGFAGIIINILCLLAIHFQMHGRFTVHFRFIVSLALSDILVALSVVSFFINTVFNPTVYPGTGSPSLRLKSRCAYIVIKAMNTTALNISLLNLMGMALDHFCAIILPLRCHQLMSKRKSTCMILSFWFIAVVCGFSDLFSVIPDRQYLDKYNFCELAFLTPYNEEFTVFFIALVCLICMPVIYVKIYMKIHERRQIVTYHQRTHLSENLRQTKKALVTTLIILGTFVLCWLPNSLYQVTLIVLVKVNPLAIKRIIPYLNEVDKYLYDLLLLNSILDPIIYAIRMPEVRCGYRKMFWRVARCFSRNPSLADKHQSATYLSMLDKKSSLRHFSTKSNATKKQHNNQTGTADTNVDKKELLIHSNKDNKKVGNGVPCIEV